MEALEHMPDFAKFMKNLVTKMRMVNFETADNTHHYIVITSRSLVGKTKDLGTFMIPCTIGAFNIAQDLCDLEANINLMSLVIYRLLGLSLPKLASMRFLNTDCTMKNPVNSLCNVLVKVIFFILELIL